MEDSQSYQVHLKLWSVQIIQWLLPLIMNPCEVLDAA